MNEQLPSFDELKELAANDPYQLEAIRNSHINHALTTASPRFKRKLAGLQFKIDAEREKHHSSPLGSCIKIYEMMNDSFSDLQEALNRFCENPLSQFDPPKHTAIDYSDNIVPFAR